MANIIAQDLNFVAEIRARAASRAKDERQYLLDIARRRIQKIRDERGASNAIGMLPWLYA